MEYRFVDLGAKDAQDYMNKLAAEGFMLCEISQAARLGENRWVNAMAIMERCKRPEGPPPPTPSPSQQG